MARNKIIPIPIPILGLNTVNPFVSFDSGYAREFTNQMLLNGRVYSRATCRTQLYNPSLTSNGVHWFDVVNADINGDAILPDGKIRRISDGSGATTIGGSPSYNATQVKHVSLNLVFGCREPRLARSPFTTWTFTTLGITATVINCGCSHRGRLYVTDGSTIEWSNVEQITGTMAGTTSLSAFLDGQSIIRMFSVTINPSLTTENVLVLFGDGGRVLVYQGENPGASNWQLIGKFDMPKPISNVSFVEISGDIFVAGRTFAYWFRDLFNGGAQTAYDNSPTRPIENLWNTATWKSSVSDQEVSHSFYMASIDAIITMSSEQSIGSLYAYTDIADYQNEGVYYVYFRKYNAWGIWFAPPFFTPVQDDGVGGFWGTSYASEIRTFGGPAFMRDSFLGVDIDVETSWKTPYLSLPGGNGLKVNGVRLFFENTISGYFHKVRAIFDNSDYNSVPFGWYTQSTVAQYNPGNYGEASNDSGAHTYNQYNPFLGVGGSGGAVSLQFTMKPKSGSLYSQRQSIYAANLILEDAGEMF